MKDRPRIFAVLALLGGLSGGTAAGDSDRSQPNDHACMEKNSTLLARLKETLDAGSTCGKASDCQVLPLMVCPLGCYAAVTKKNVEKVRAEIEDVTARLDPACLCEYKCSALPKSTSCVKGHCTIEGRR